MNTDLRRSQRKVDYVPVQVNAFDGRSNTVLAGPFSGRIIDVSIHGACLLMTQVIIGGHHIFHSTREYSSGQLQVIIDLPPDIINMVLPCIPVRIEPFRHRQAMGYKIGIEFLVHPEGSQMTKLQEGLNRAQSARADWWLSRTSKGNDKGKASRQSESV